MTALSSQPTLAFPKGTAFVDGKGMPTPQFVRNYEELLYRVNKITEAAHAYSALNTGTATTAQIATALNTFVAAIIET